MKTVVLLFATISAFSQTVSVNGIAASPDITTAMSGALAKLTTGTNGTALVAIASGDTTVQLPTNVATGCTESYAVTAITSTSNTSTLTAQTTNVPLGTKVTVSNAVTAGYNATFVTTNAPTTSATIQFALTIADGTYSNPSASTTGYPVLTYNRCAVLIDSEVIGVTGTTDGTNYTTTRGDLQTVAAGHSLGANVQLLKYSGLRYGYRTAAAGFQQYLLGLNPSPRVTTLQAQIAALQLQLAALLLVQGQ